MPNLTSYHPPHIHLSREIPKTYCYLLQHEFNYNHFLRTHIANIQSSLDSSNKKYSMNNLQKRHQYFDENLSHVYRNGVASQDENYKNQKHISHFRLRQNRWKEKVDSENKRFIHSLIYHRNKYRPVHDRTTAQKAYEEHLKLLEAMSQYSKYNVTNSICQNRINRYNLKMNKSLKYQRIETNKSSYKSNSYLQNILQRTLNDAIRIYNQPLPSAPHNIQTLYSENNQHPKSRLHRQQQLFQSLSYRPMFEPQRNAEEQEELIENDTDHNNYD